MKTKRCENLDLLICFQMQLKVVLNVYIHICEQHLKVSEVSNETTYKWFHIIIRKIFSLFFSLKKHFRCKNTSFWENYLKKKNGPINSWCPLMLFIDVCINVQDHFKMHLETYLKPTFSHLLLFKLPPLGHL